ncbi:MAG: inner membrane CreD family protein [Candidatus Omnitrophica bacterium]|nr:inner membrane CreD family protein [Candidatus Omnitrophota bacterium]
MSIQNEISFLERFTRSSVVAVLILGFLVLILQIPILMIYGVIQERTGTRNEAIREVVSRWGDHQSITGPRLVVPYQCRIERDEKDKKPIIETRLAHFLPANLKISAQMDSEVRYRGIFEVPIYTMTATIEDPSCNRISMAGKSLPRIFSGSAPFCRWAFRIPVESPAMPHSTG